MFSSNTNNDCESIDYEFFESEGNHVKMYGEMNQSDCSKIVTKAIIETNPSKLVEFGDNLQKSNSYLKRKSIYNEDGDQCKNYNNQFSFSPSSSVEKNFMNSACLDESLLNCLAYNEENYENQDSISFLSDDKECSNNSLSDSTITTVTSDFTSVSLFSCLSDSSYITDASLDSSTPQNDIENDGTENVNISNHEHEENDAENVSNESLNVNDQLDYEKCTVSKENQSVKDEYVNGDKYEDGLENHYNENLDQIRDDNNFESEQVQRSPSESDEDDNDNCFEENYDNDNCVEKPISVDNDCENSNSSICYESDYESESIKENENTSGKNSNISVLEEELEDISLTTHLSSKSCSLRTPLGRSLNKIRARRKECNMSFSREELIKIERDNLTLLKKIMAHAKPRTVSLNQPFSHKKTSAAINRAKQQKKIDQDNYILYSKISAMGRMKKVF